MQEQKQIELLKDRLIDLQDNVIQSKDLQIQILKSLNRIMAYCMNTEIRLQKLERLSAITNAKKLGPIGKGNKNARK